MTGQTEPIDFSIALVKLLTLPCSRKVRRNRVVMRELRPRVEPLTTKGSQRQPKRAAHSTRGGHDLRSRRSDQLAGAGLSAVSASASLADSGKSETGRGTAGSQRQPASTTAVTKRHKWRMAAGDQMVLD